MTTVAYRDGIMAADSRSSDDGRHLTKCDKIYRLQSGALLGICGDDDIRDVITLFNTVTCESELPSREELANLKIDGGYLFVLPNKQVWYVSIGMLGFDNTDEWCGWITEIKENFAAIGSGSHLAIGALEFGATAAEAVSVAAKWDLYSSPPVVTMELGAPLKNKPRKRKKNDT